MIVSPSLLSADFTNLTKEIDMINHSDAAWLHLDVMDGVFVPNISFGFPVIKSVASICKKKLDAHFMTVHPENYVQRTADLGVMMMTVHAEVCPDLHAIISQIHAAGMKAGISLKPATELSVIEDVLCEADMFLMMSVNPGFSGQKYFESSTEKIRTLKGMLTQAGSNALIQVDGGINATTAPLVANAGVDVVVCGDYVFKAQDPYTVIKSLVAL